APLPLHGLERGGRLEAGGGDDDAGAVRGAGEVTENHAEAVVERHRDADPIGLGVPAAFPDEEPVVDDVVVGQRRALGEAGRPAGVLDVYRVVEGQPRLARGQRLPIALYRRQPAPLRRPQLNDALQPAAVAAYFL